MIGNKKQLTKNLKTKNTNKLISKIQATQIECIKIKQIACVCSVILAITKA